MVVKKARGQFIGTSLFTLCGLGNVYDISATMSRPDTMPTEAPNPDTIRVRVLHNGNVVAMADAKLAYATPGTFNPNRQYLDATEFGIDYVSGQLGVLRNTPGAYCPPNTSVLVIQSIEVESGYKRDGIATSILDFLTRTLKPDYITAVILPAYTPRFGSNRVSPAASDGTGLEKWLRANGFKNIGTALIPSGGPNYMREKAFSRKR